MSTTATTSVQNIRSRRFGSDQTPYLGLNLSQPSSTFSSPRHLSSNTDSDDFFSTVPRSARSSSPLNTTTNSSSTLYSAVAHNPSSLSDFDLTMASNFDFQHPTTNFHHQAFGQGAVAFPSNWPSNGGVGVSQVAKRMQQLDRTNNQLHAPSTASIGTNPGRQPQHLQQQATSMRTAGSRKSQGHPQYRGSSSATSHHQLPTPTSTPTRKQFAAAAAAAAAGGSSTHGIESVDLLMTQLRQQQQQHQTQQADDDATDMSQSTRPSFSSVGQDPMTPMTAVSDYREDSMRHGTDMTSSSIPKLERTITDAYNDELYFQQPMHAPAPPSNQSYLMAHNNKLVQDRLQAAAMARSPSTSSNHSQMSQYKYLPAQLQQQVRRGGRDHPEADYQVSPRTESEPKTISPKDALLDYKSSENETPLFTQASTDFTFAVAPAVAKPAYTTPTTMSFGMGPWSTDLSHSTLTSAPVPTYGAFAQPTIPASYGLPVTHHAAPQQSYGSSRRGPENPEFPAHLTSMESSASEQGFPGSSAASSALTTGASPKPLDTTANSGTYSCTFHGCSQRFTTPQKLQKHKRDAHRANTNVTPGVGSGMTTAQLMERNSQSGPHKCERINPTTGKPCNTIFSRPYDLTRHEDTIHNVRKQKVRCALCTEEKTFSRSDALTRHMRVVHPEVDFPGKHRKRGGRD